MADEEKNDVELWARVSDLKLKDLMTLVPMIQAEIEKRLNAPGPKEVTGVFLRPTDEPGVFEQRLELWRRRSKDDPKYSELSDREAGTGPAEKVTSEYTGRKYRFIENVASELRDDSPDDPRFKDRLALVRPEDFTLDLFEQIEGPPNDLKWGIHNYKTKWD